MRFSTLYQLLRSLVKRNLCPKGMGFGIIQVTLILAVLATPLQQGQCLTAEEIAYLKKAGVSDKTIQLMIEQENEKRRHSRTGIWEVEDEEGKRSTVYSVGDDEETLERKRIEQEKVDRAWEMLRNLNIVIDAREKE